MQEALAHKTANKIPFSEEIPINFAKIIPEIAIARGINTKNAIRK